ncbi:MAG: glycosyltransferase family 1 protein [Bacteroidales bacterium]|nr:glycosyltransferase family 1 protein [Bacteroidales bacterium]
MNRGGTENAIMNYYRCLDRSIIQFDFILTCANKCAFEDEILALGGKIFRIPLLTIKAPYRYVKALYKFISEHPEYRIVHSHTSSKSVIPLTIAKHHGVPIRIAHSHSSQSESGFTGMIRNFLKGLLKFSANTYFSCGEQAAKWLYGENPDIKVELIRNVINADVFRFNPNIRNSLRNQLGIDDNTLVIGHVARLCDVKNHKFSVEILRECRNLHHDCRLLLVGDGPLRSEIVEYAHQLGVEDYLIMPGVVSNVYDYEQAMDVFILPSFYEGLPLSIIEAQVSGLPCFTTKDKVSNECSVTDLVSYLPLEAGAKVWAEAIIEAAGKKRVDRFEEIKKAGYDAQSSAEKLQKRYIELYNLALTV